ncbi:MAG TPA: hypothetical protein VIG50_00360 [Vicinamibacteria bacterium]
MGDSGTRARGHFSEEDWLDYARGQVGAAGDAMARHLDACGRCAATLRLWQSAVAHASPEPAYAPPSAALRSVRASFAVVKPRAAGSLLTRAAALVFDSLAQPALAGVRAAAPSARQMLYRSSPYAVRVTVEAAPETGRLLVVGHVVDERQPGRRLRALPVLALRGRLAVDRTLTNELGEFEMEPEAADDLRLSVGVPDAAPLSVSLRARKPPPASRPGVLGRPGRVTHTRRRPGGARPRR